MAKAFRHASLIFFFFFVSLLIVLSFWHPPIIWKSFQFSSRGACEGVNVPVVPPLCMVGTFDGFSFGVVLFLLFNYLLVGVLGYFLIRPVFANRSFRQPVLNFVASFFVGYTALVGIIRILSLIFPYKDIYWPVITAEVLIIAGFFVALFLTDRTLRRKIWALSIGGSSQAVVSGFVWGAAILAFFISVLLLQVRQDNFAWNGHGTNQYAYLLELWRANPPAHFVVVPKHYDELIFHYFLTMPLNVTFDPILPWWVTLAVVKTSLWTCLILVFRKIGLSTAFSVIASLFMFVGTSSLVPTKYYLLFDSANFLYFAVHAGRVVGIGVIFILVADVLFSSPKTKLSLVALALIGLGLTGTSIANVFWLVLTYFALILAAAYYRDRYPDKNEAGI